MHIAIPVALLCISYAVRATAGQHGPPHVPMAIQAFRDNIAGTAIADVSKTCRSKGDESLDCDFDSPLEHSAVFSVQPNGVMKTLVPLGCVSLFRENATSTVVIVVPFSCSNKTARDPKTICYADVHIEILGPVSSPHLRTACKDIDRTDSFEKGFDSKKPEEAARPPLQPSTPQATITGTDVKQSSEITPAKSDRAASSVEIAAIGAASTIIIFLTACLTLKCWLHFRYRNLMVKSLNENSPSSLAGQMTNPVDEPKVGSEQTEPPGGLRSDTASNIGIGTQNLKETQRWVTQQQKLRDKQWTSAVATPHLDLNSFQSSLVNSEFATSATFPEQAAEEDFDISPNLDDQVITVPPSDTEFPPKHKWSSPAVKSIRHVPASQGRLFSPSHTSSPHRVQGPTFQLPATLTHAQLPMQRKSSSDASKVASVAAEL